MEQENISLETIYVSIPSFYDEELIPTIDDVFAKAEHPNRVFVGIALQDSNKKFLKKVKAEIKKYGKNVNLTFTKLTAKNALTDLGVGRGRAKAHSFYNEEDYFLQVDSHSMFAENWDTILIEMLAEAKAAAQNKKTILTAYAGNYFLTDSGERTLDFPEGMNAHAGFYYPLYSRFETRMGMPVWDTVPISRITDSTAKYIPAPKFNANFAFGDKDFARRLGLEISAVFFEEELVQSINILASEWSMAIPNIENAIVRHYYLPPNATGPVNRKSAGDYMKQFGVFDQMNARQRENYKSFITTEGRENFVYAYQNYANVDLEHGRLTDSMLHPTSWVLETVNYENVVAAFNYVESPENENKDEASEDSGEGCGCKHKPHEESGEQPHSHDLETANNEHPEAEKPKEARPWDLLNPNIGRVSEEIKELRMDACRNCEFFVKLTQQCTKCGCIMPAKTSLPHASCPIGKWDSVPDDQEK
jgi:hypothetical protein